MSVTSKGRMKVDVNPWQFVEIFWCLRPWLCIIWLGHIYWTLYGPLGVGWGQVGGCLITIPFVRWQFLCWMLWFSGWMVVIPRTCTSCKMYGSSKFRPSDVSWDVLRGILAGSWQMGQTRHGFPWVPKSWVGHSSGMWGLHVSSNLKDVCLTTAGIVRWICVCSFSAVLLDLSTFKKEWSRLCLLPLFFKGRWRNEPKQLVISMLLYIQKSKTIGNLYTKKNEWFMKYLLQSFTYIHTPFCQFFPYEGSIFVSPCPVNNKSHPGDLFSNQGNSRVRRWLPTVWHLRRDR